MSSFTRYAAVAVVVLSLGFLVASAPLVTYASIPAVLGKDEVSLVIAELCFGLDAKIEALLHCGTENELRIALEAIVAALQTCANGLLKIGADVTVDADAKVNIVACFAAIVTLCAQVCARLLLKFDVSILAALFVKLDIALHACLANLNICVAGIVAPIAKAVAGVIVTLMVNLKLNLCLGVLGL